MPLALPRTVVKTDVCDSSRGLRARQIYLDRALRQVLAETLATAVPYEPESWHCRIDGDSSIWVIPPSVPKAWIAADQTRNLDMALRRFNRHVSEDGRLRLRVAIDHGEVEIEDKHIGGRAITTAARLCDSPALREAMSAASQVDLGLIVSDSFYHDVIIEGELDLDPAKFVEVDVEVKAFRGKAWIHLVGGQAQPSTGSPVSSLNPKPQPNPPGKSMSQHNRINSEGDFNVHLINNSNVQH